MANITISAQILSGNLGDGWTNENDTADALAEFTQVTWAADTAALRAAGHGVEIKVSVQYNTSGNSRSVDIDSDDWDVRIDESAITSENRIWERFCESEAAAALIANA